MTGVFVVVLADDQGTYGPFNDREEAVMFAGYLTREVDPATVHELKSAARELLAWHATVRARGGGL